MSKVQNETNKIRTTPPRNTKWILEKTLSDFCCYPCMAYTTTRLRKCQIQYHQILPVAGKGWTEALIMVAEEEKPLRQSSGMMLAGKAYKRYHNHELVYCTAAFVQSLDWELWGQSGSQLPNDQTKILWDLQIQIEKQVMSNQTDRSG